MLQVLQQASLIDIDITFLPVKRMRQISRVIELDGPSIVGHVDLSPNHWVYDQHFPGDPVFPGTLLIEAAGQLVALWAWANGARGRPRLVRTSAEFLSPVTPDGLQLLLHAEVKRKRHLHFATVSIRCDSREVARVTALLAVLPMERTEA